MVDIQAIRKLHRDLVERWHEQEVDNPYISSPRVRVDGGAIPARCGSTVATAALPPDDGLLGIVCQQFSFNFRLWHEEDIARSPDADDSRIAQVKRNIDRLNQQRNDWIEKIDDHFSETLAARGVTPRPGAGLNTETPGSVIDRLSILALRIYHMEEQIRRPTPPRNTWRRVNESWPSAWFNWTTCPPR